MRRVVAGLGFLWVGATATCSDDVCEAPCETPTYVMMTYGGEGFFDAPFPSDARRDADGRPIVAGFPNPQAIFLVDSVLDILKNDADGFGMSSGIFFRTTDAVDPASLPTLPGSVEPGSSVQLIGVEETAPDYLKRYPVDVRFAVDPGPYGAPNLLSIVPLQGVPLRPKTRYAAVVTRRVHDHHGRALGPSSAAVTIFSDGTPEGMTDAQAAEQRIIRRLVEAGLAETDVAAFTVFTTGDPVSTQGIAADRAYDDGVPLANEPFTKTDDFPTYCVYSSTVDMPVYQAGTPPYSSEGGGFVLDETGAPILQRHERARIVITVPKTAPNAEGEYPLVVFSRTGGGGDRPLVDRGVRATNGGEAIEPGTGPALEFARVGYAGVSIDGPHGGLRNITGGDEQLLVFNFQNPLALRDNVRQSAVELDLAYDIVKRTDFDVSDCAGAGDANGVAAFHAEALMGHSMGASIAPLAAAFELRFRALILSGAGGSFIASMVHKQKPIPVKPLAELILGLTVAGYPLEESSPMLSMLQWAGEPADVPIYGRHLVREPLKGGPRHILMMQGIVDHYIMPPIANAASLSFGLDLAGGALDSQTPELVPHHPLAALLPYSGGKEITLPAGANQGIATAVVTQTAEDGIEDGHEVVFQTEAPKHAYACFLRTLQTGTPRVPSPGVPGDACD